VIAQQLRDQKKIEVVELSAEAKYFMYPS